MCGRYVFTSPAEALLRLFGIEIPAEAPSAYNIAPGQDAWIVRAGAQGTEAAALRWGLVPFWAKDTNIGYKMINARSETAAEKPAFREALKRRRCLIPADAFYEWHAGENPKQPYLVYRKDRSPLLFAGLWECWEKGDGPLETFAVLTKPADEAIAWLHDRQPVVLGQDASEAWLNGGSEVAQAVLEKPAAVDWAWHKVSRAVNATRNEGPSLVDPWQQAQGSLL